MPKQLMSEIYRGSVEIEGDTYEMEDITATQEAGQTGAGETISADTPELDL